MSNSKYALSSAQARRNSLNSPWRRQAACATQRAREFRALLDRENAAAEKKKAAL